MSGQLQNSDDLRKCSSIVVLMAPDGAIHILFYRIVLASKLRVSLHKHPWIVLCAICGVHSLFIKHSTPIMSILLTVLCWTFCVQPC